MKIRSVLTPVNLTLDLRSGKKTVEKRNLKPEVFIRRQCVGKVAEVHDLFG